MSYISKAFSAIWQIIKNPFLLNKILDADANWEKHIATRYSDSVPIRTIPFSQFMSNSDQLSQLTLRSGNANIADLLLLKSLARSIDDCHYFEIGTWLGESVVNVAPLAASCHSLDLPDEVLRKLKWSEIKIKEIGSQIENQSNIKLHRADSRTFDFQSLNQRFDLIFIDGNHHYKYVKNDTEKVFTHLVHDHSIVVWHDFIGHNGKIRHEVWAGILDGLNDDFHQHLYHVDNTLCIIYHRDSFPWSPWNSNAAFQNQFEMTIKSFKRNNEQE